ncbi:MAG: universal stress protein [Bacteroidetes bacterium]|nr:MAG: universal stress protein [Bacteroidota bacterium]
MGKIISAIDFSDCSINAFRHALSIAQVCKCDLVLVWVGKPASQREKYENQQDEPVEGIKQRFGEMIDKYQPQLPHSKLTFKIRKGKVYREIAAEAKTSRAMLVIAGTHGASGFDEFWIGSNAYRIVSACECPVITIRGGINIRRPLHRIVVPIDSTLETRQKATFTGYLAKMHDAEVHILRLYSSKVKAIRMNVDFYASQVARHFEQEGIRHKIDVVETSNLADAMISYAKEVDANLISVMTEQETTTSNLWMGPYAQQVVNHSPIPVLSIHTRDLMTIATN